MPGPQIILATHNPGKVRELRAILAGIPYRITSLLDYPDLPEVEEDGLTLEENALKKAREIHRLTRLPSLADDSGLEVFALGMRPGVYSARYAGERASYDDNNQKLLAELEGVERREAQFRCVAAFVCAGTEKTIEGICAGRIGSAGQGSGGFGYDPLFYPDGSDQSFAELSIEVKNRISHRAKAFLAMELFLREFAKNNP